MRKLQDDVVVHRPIYIQSEYIYIGNEVLFKSPPPFHNTVFQYVGKSNFTLGLSSAREAPVCYVKLSFKLAGG